MQLKLNDTYEATHLGLVSGGRKGTVSGTPNRMTWSPARMHVDVPTAQRQLAQIAIRANSVLCLALRSCTQLAYSTNSTNSTLKSYVPYHPTEKIVNIVKTTMILWNLCVQACTVSAGDWQNRQCSKCRRRGHIFNRHEMSKMSSLHVLSEQSL